MEFRKMIEEFERNIDYYEYTECSREEADKLAEDGVKIIKEDNNYGYIHSNHRIITA